MTTLAHHNSVDSASFGSHASGVRLPSRQRAKRTNDPLAGVSLNTARGRRVGDLTRAYLQALGHPTDVMREAEVVAAAELQVLAEEARSGALQQHGAVCDINQIVRLQSVADRALKRLGIKPGAQPKPPSLKEYLAARQAKAQTAKADPPSPDPPQTSEVPR